MNLDAIRAELPVLGHVAYLNAGTFGPLPARTGELMCERIQQELDHGRLGRPYFDGVRSLRTYVREAIARLLNAPPESVALTRSTSDGCNIAVASLRLGPNDEIVTTDDEHFGLLGPLHVSGARVRVAAARDLPLDEVAASIEAEIGPRTKLIALSHVTWTSGRILPVERFAGRGIPVLVDGAQGTGAVPVDVQAIGCDFYTVSGQKWLLGPDGTGALYVRPETIEQLAIAFPSYFSQQRHEQTGAFLPADGAARFEPGTLPAPSLAGLLASIAFGEEAGPDRFARARAMTERFRSELAERYEVLTPPDQATLVSFLPHGEAEAVVAELANRGVIVRAFPGLPWIRASIGFWTAEAELERLLSGLAAIG